MDRPDQVDQIITGNLLGASAFAYAYSRMPDVRFRRGFTHTGDESLFWLDLALRSRKFAFSSEPACRYGAGVNVYSESAWGTDKYLSVIIDEVKYRRVILAEYPLSEGQRRYLRGRISGFRRSFVMGLLHILRAQRRPVSGRILRGYLAQDPAFPLAVWPFLLQLLWARGPRGRLTDRTGRRAGWRHKEGPPRVGAPFAGLVAAT